MAINIRMGIPEMAELWNDLQSSYRNGTISKKDEELYKKWGNALKKLSNDPKYPSLNTHEIASLSRRYGMKVWQSYLENKKSGQGGCIGYMDQEKMISQLLVLNRILKMIKMDHTIELLYLILMITEYGIR